MKVLIDVKYYIKGRSLGVSKKVKNEKMKK
jgi:hypothetical protein